MTNRDLKKRWARTGSYLEAAFSLLPQSPAESPEGGQVTQYKEFFSHNELELALDELEGLGANNPVPREFWVRLLDAAEEMGLQAHAMRYRQRQA